MPKKRSSAKPASQPANDAEDQMSRSESNTTSPQTTTPEPAAAQESPTAEPAIPASPTFAMPSAVDTSGLVLVDKDWMQAMELSVRGLAQKIEQMNGSQNGQPVNGQTGQNGKPRTWVDGLIEVGMKILDKLPPMQSGASPLEQTFAQRYMNLLDTAYGRYIPPASPPPLIPAQVPPAGT